MSQDPIGESILVVLVFAAIIIAAIVGALMWVF